MKYIVLKNGDIVNSRGRVLKQFTRKDGYKTVKINGKTKFVHRLVAAAHCEKVPGANEVDHIDGNRGNNNANNLRFVSRKTNLEARNVRNGWTVYKDQVCQINAKIEEWAKQINAFYAKQ